jgi:GT2 family glycosyltransferase
VNSAFVAGRLSVIIPHWNAKDLLPVCLDALAAQTHPDVEVILVDNASSDGSQAFVKENYPSVKLLELPENRGFTGACNAGFESATGEFLALLNNDTEVVPDWAAALVAGFSQFPEAGFAASRMMLFDRRDHVHAVGDFYRVDGLPGNRGVWQADTGQFDQPEFVFSACGGASVYRRVMLNDIGLLDDDFFFSGEDVDLGWRAQLAGYRCIYLPEARVYHMLSATGGGVTGSYYIGRNMLYILLKDYPAPLWRKYGGQILKQQAKIAWDALRAWRGAAARARLRGMMVGLLTAPRMLSKRRKIQAARRVSIEYLESILTPVTGD